ncbi:MAG: hypothetical protein CMJ58_21295 [Planctomycetaceae bacterium]|nr:hypothetical protein [Planctomycetaceae bacterium]
MTPRIRGSSPRAAAHEQQALKDAIIAFWSELRVSDDTGDTTWEALEPLEQQVTESLNRDPPDIALAMSLTRKAQRLIAGLDDL